MVVYLVVLLAAILLGVLVYRYDMYDKEPWYVLLFALVVGYATFWGLGYVEDYTNARLGFYQSDGHTAGQAAVAASHEELAKLLVVVLVAVLFRRHFNDPMDGLIYGAVVGIGMAAEESVFYLRMSFSSGNPEPALDLIGREVTRVMLHILLGGLSGFGVGLVVEHSRLGRRWVLLLIGSLAASMTIHFLWDYLCGIPAAGGTSPAGELALRGSAVLLMLLAMGLFGAAVAYGSRLSRERFAPGSETRLWRRGESGGEGTSPLPGGPGR
jgi:RsiW-degrading membrane proteinase PrsW (M82 family)